LKFEAYEGTSVGKKDLREMQGGEAKRRSFRDLPNQSET
jgi:hypothetical protein